MVKRPVKWLNKPWIGDRVKVKSEERDRSYKIDMLNQETKMIGRCIENVETKW